MPFDKRKRAFAREQASKDQKGKKIGNGAYKGKSLNKANSNITDQETPHDAPNIDSLTTETQPTSEVASQRKERKQTRQEKPHPQQQPPQPQPQPHKQTNKQPHKQSKQKQHKNNTKHTCKY